MPNPLLFGFSDLKDVVNNRVTPELIPVVSDAVDRAVAVHTEMTNRMIALFASKTTAYKIRYKSPVAAKLQALDEHGRARKMKAAGHYDIAFPLKSAGSAFGWTRLAAAKKTVQDVNDALLLMLDADKRWLRDEIFAALLNNTSYVFSDEEHGDLTVKGLANGDSDTYLIRSGAEDGETANHFQVISALDDANQNFGTIYRSLTKRPENAGDGKVITFVPTNLRDEVESLAALVIPRDTDIADAVTKNVLVGNLDVPVPGDVIGKIGKNWVVELPALSDNYMLSVITTGERALAFREQPEPELQGFRRVAERNDDPYYESQFERHGGFGAQNRVNAYVTKVGTGAYAPPTDLTYENGQLV